MSTGDTTLEAFDWRQEPEAALFMNRLVADAVEACPALARFERDLRELSGTRLIDWVDHVGLPAATRIDGVALEQRLETLGFLPATDNGGSIWRHPRAQLAPIRIVESPRRRLAIKADSVIDYVAVRHLGGTVEIEGQPMAPLRRVQVVSQDDLEVWVVERHGDAGWALSQLDSDTVTRLLEFQELFRTRKREFEDSGEGFAAATDLIRRALKSLSTARVCDLFFQAEREYWQSRNRAAQVQKGRQDRLGLGWANHDHHTYRCSREHFADLVAVLELLGFDCRERFYAGEQAGWGAQVLENPECGVVIFADVDLSADEVLGDFAHEGLSSRDQLGTVGLWCKLHGEAFLQAGMHHLECQFDFDSARIQLKTAGINTMAPFTDFDYLRQAFTEGELWPVDPRRVEAALREGHIDQEQARRFLDQGVLGSHMEILERNDGYKGFNQTGISEIIRKTDPRGFTQAGTG